MKTVRRVQWAPDVKPPRSPFAITPKTTSHLPPTSIARLVTLGHPVYGKAVWADGVMHTVPSSMGRRIRTYGEPVRCVNGAMIEQVAGWYEYTTYTVRGDHIVINHISHHTMEGEWMRGAGLMALADRRDVYRDDGEWLAAYIEDDGHGWV